MGNRIRYVAYAFILFHLAGALLFFKYLNEYTPMPKPVIITTAWHLVNVIIWIGIIRYSRVCYWINVPLMILYCIVGVVGLTFFIMGNPQPYDIAIPVVFLGSLAVIGNYVLILENHTQFDSFFWIASLLLIVLSVLPLWVLILERRLFSRKKSIGGI